jgi:hypothetical protein
MVNHHPIINGLLDNEQRSLEPKLTKFLMSKSREFISQMFRGSRESAQYESGPLCGLLAPPEIQREGGAPRRPNFKYLWLDFYG